MAHAQRQLSFAFAGVVMGSYFSPPPSFANCEQICGERAAPHVAFCPSPELIHHGGAASKHQPVGHVQGLCLIPTNNNNCIYCI